MDDLGKSLKGPDAMELQFDAEKHEYKVGDRKLHSVTEIVRMAFPDTFKGIPESQKAYYFARGSANHKLFEDVENGVDGGFDYDPEVEKFRAGHARFLRETGFKALPGGIELRVKNMDLGYAGTIDRLGTIQGRVILLDFKTNKVYDGPVALQTALYALALPGYKFAELERFGVAIKKDGTYAMSRKYPDSDEAEAVYWASKYLKEAVS